MFFLPLSETSIVSAPWRHKYILALGGLAVFNPGYVVFAYLNTNDATAIINWSHKMAAVCCRSLSFRLLTLSLTDAVIDVKKLDITYS